MTLKTASGLGAFLIVPVLFLGLAQDARAAEPAPFTLSVKNITMIPKPPECEARATKRVIRSGGSFDIVWKSEDAVKMVGMVKGGQEWPADGRQRVSIAVPGKHVFPLTFVGKNGATATCTVKVFVHAKRT